MKKLEAASQKVRKLCMDCGDRPWAAITIKTGLKRCVNCWQKKYFAVRLED
jgi:hypothetical protein